ncbi:hypothetical protein SVAN01_11811 [Stagonosporopsis vannaccii]|nr:hypothetical protein SVAN01_11811 [Stagonosporopsis vannaccii]
MYDVYDAPAFTFYHHTTLLTAQHSSNRVSGTMTACRSHSEAPELSLPEDRTKGLATRAQGCEACLHIERTTRIEPWCTGIKSRI